MYEINNYKWILIPRMHSICHLCDYIIFNYEFKFNYVVRVKIEQSSSISKSSNIIYISILVHSRMKMYIVLVRA